MTNQVRFEKIALFGIRSYRRLTWHKSTFLNYHKVSLHTLVELIRQLPISQIILSSLFAVIQGMIGDIFFQMLDLNFRDFQRFHQSFVCDFFQASQESFHVKSFVLDSPGQNCDEDVQSFERDERCLAGLNSFTRLLSQLLTIFSQLIVQVQSRFFNVIYEPKKSFFGVYCHSSHICHHHVRYKRVINFSKST